MIYRYYIILVLGIFLNLYHQQLQLFYIYLLTFQIQSIYILISNFNLFLIKYGSLKALLLFYSNPNQIIILQYQRMLLIYFNIFFQVHHKKHQLISFQDFNHQNVQLQEQTIMLLMQMCLMESHVFISNQKLFKETVLLKSFLNFKFK